MPITARTPREALFAFRDRLNQLLQNTLTHRPLVAVLTEPAANGASGQMVLTFREAGYPTTIPLRTHFGELLLFLDQRCETHRIRRREHQVATVSYQYYLAQPGDPEPLVRWEYVKRWPDQGSRWCRHHLQGPIRLPVGGNGVSLNDLHLPTGYVVVEDVIRFCLCELDVTSLSANWHERLEESYERFRRESTPPR